jgi:hypothetical protein
MNWLKAKAWSPYAAGIVIGLLQIPAFLLVSTALGASSSYVTLASSIALAIDPAVLDLDYARKHLEGAKNWWQVGVVVGIAAGAFLSARLSGLVRKASSPVWQGVAGQGNRIGRLANAFAGGFLLLLGARIADGCTSGHGISGIAQLAIGSFIAVAAMFAGGIAVATALKK